MKVYYGTKAVNKNMVTWGVVICAVLIAVGEVFVLLPLFLAFAGWQWHGVAFGALFLLSTLCNYALIHLCTELLSIPSINDLSPSTPAPLDTSYHSEADLYQGVTLKATQEVKGLRGSGDHEPVLRRKHLN